VMHWRRHGSDGRQPVVAAVLVLIGGFLLRVVIILSSEMA
jgi:formate-dependent nitrite reductase membrane component NrfD